VDNRNDIRYSWPLGAEPSSPSEDGLKLLSSWAATLDQTDHAETAD
jgi:hypothetical protein